MISLFFSAILTSIPFSYISAQVDDNEISMDFIKSIDSLQASELYFNVLKIRNNSSVAINGSLAFSGPDNWRIITFPVSQLTINPGDTLSIPVRVSPAVDAVGGITYILSASLRLTDRIITENTYFTLPSKPKWDISTPNSSIFFTDQSPNTKFQIYVVNKGNTNELIRIHMQIGRLLVLQGDPGTELIEFINLPAFTDTTLTYSVTFEKKLSYAERSRYENNWKESAVIVSASNERIAKDLAIMIRKLNSSFYNQRDQASSPLNIDFQVYNVMSNQKARFNTRAYGSILFPKNRDVQYLLGLQNIYFDSKSNKNFDINNQLLYSLQYTDNRNSVLFGYNVYGGDLHTLNGRGITGTHDITSASKMSYSLIQNPYSNSLGEHLGYSFNLKNIQLNTGVIHENANSGNHIATSLLAGVGFTMFKYHSLTLDLLGSKSQFRQLTAPALDTSVIGFSYRILYRMQYRKFELRANFLNTNNNYIRNSGMQQIYLDGKYMLNDRTAFILNGNRQYYSLTRYPYNFYTPANYNSNDYIRLTASISQGNLIYQVGPTYNGSMRQYRDPLSGYYSEYKTYQPGVWGAITFRINGYRSITPNITVSNLRFHYTTEDPLGENYSWTKNVYYTAGLNYYDNSWKINAYYTSGTTTDLYRSIQVNEKPVISRSIQVRPSYEKYFFNRTVKFSAYVNYAYYMPSGRENISYSVRYDHYLKGGWSIYLNAFVYSNTRVTEENGRISGKDLNVLAGLTKSFELQQPRLKYYDFRAVFFNDLDGNLVKSDNEPPVSNILVNIEKNQALSVSKSNIMQVDLLSDINGEIYFENLPMDFYKLTFTPLVNLQNLYFLNGSEQTFFNEKKEILYIPLAESYKIKGKVVVVRDPNSTEGKISLSGIRVTALGVNGEVYSVLTDKFGVYILNVPKGDKFRVRVNNVFGEQFQIERDEMEVQFTQNRTINLDFVFIEKRREIRFNGGNDIQRFNSIQSGSVR